MNRRSQKTIALLVVALGAALMTYTVVVESEPGLLPLLLVVTGAAWYGIARLKTHA